jgi:phenylpropionate dioxygenase-like ring-hydroxylating dioxygenase large terminal subunit
LIEFSELVQTGEQERAEKFFGEKSRPFNRYTTLTKKREQRPKIVEVQNGSIELVIAGASIAVAVIMPLVRISVTRYFERLDETITFELSPEDKALNKIMTAYENGDFGKDREGLEVLMSVLRKRKYNVDVLANNIFLIEHVVEKYSQRIIKTIKKNK